MSFIKSVFGGKKEEQNKTPAPSNASINQPARTTSFDSRTKISDLALLALSERFSVGETKYPDYLRSKYGIGFPKERLLALATAGYIRPSTAIESLPNLKVTELKTIASGAGIKTTGKKDDLCNRIATEISSDYLETIINERHWVITRAGHELINQNPAISFFTADHPYSLEEFGLNIVSISNLCKSRPGHSIRDILWGEFNRLSELFYKNAIQNKSFHEYCDLLRVMALFLEEENRHKSALAMYMRYLYYRANFEAGMSALNYYSITKDINTTADMLNMNTEIYPFIAKEIHEMTEGCALDSGHLYSYMIETFSRENDGGIFEAKELADLILCGLNGDSTGQRNICLYVMGRVAKRMKPTQKGKHGIKVKWKE